MHAPPAYREIFSWLHAERTGPSFDEKENIMGRHVYLPLILGLVMVALATAPLVAGEVPAQAKPQIESPAAAPAANAVEPQLGGESAAVCATPKEDDATAPLGEPVQPAGGLCSHHATTPPCSQCPPGRLECECWCNVEVVECLDGCGANPPCVLQCELAGNACMDGCL